jgi:hypothetical protein
VAVANLCVLVKVITNKEVPPALIALGVKLLATCGKLAATVSGSIAVHTPAKQVVAVLVLVTVGGAEIEAVLVICVCAKAACEAKSASIITSTNAIALVLRFAIHFDRVKRFNTLKEANFYFRTLHCIIANYIILQLYCIDIVNLNTSNNPSIQLKATTCEKDHTCKH